ncbi:uncharacterized protein LOC127833409 [Dreissena polymorpha]|uniref:Uncharacterized protein n=1 Tax=Dreissena polymorpha TaxID=45954 RepID=A0A9D4G2M5_DREPO|nr:uncharacterized protein LOC127833409 [Dreissena polymorpha]KAH3808019.1 hypothetical protein DPMN_136367 [Dreissena polymorpha]
MAQLEQNIWAMVEDVSESAVKITEKFFRPLVKLSDVEVKTCLEILKRLGLAEYNKKVKEFSPASSKKRKIEDGSTCEMEERNQYEDLLEKNNQMAKDFRASQDRCSVLENENSELKSQLAKQSTQDHKKTGKTTETIEEPMEAFWRFDDGRVEWLPAKLIKRYANGGCSVQFSDGFSRIKSSWVRRVGDL